MVYSDEQGACEEWRSFAVLVLNEAKRWLWAARTSEKWKGGREQTLDEREMEGRTRTVTDSGRVSLK